tara:strand:- start:61963 stop:64935 length:2973 start_codon:yes stop_codon:yes gene_type:complete
MLKRILILFFTIVVGFGSAVYYLGPAYLKRKINLFAYASMRLEANYDQIKVESFNPLKINVSNITIKKNKDFYFSIKKLNFDLNLKDILMNWGNKSIKFQLFADEFNASYKDVPIPGTEKPTEMPKNVSGEAAANMRDYLKTSYGINALDLLIKIGKFDYQIKTGSGAYRLYGNNTTLKVSSLETPIEFTLNSYLYSDANLGPLSKTYVPINIHSQVTIKDATANILKSEFQIAGIRNTFAGLVSLKNMDFDTTLKTHIPKIETLDFLKTYKDKFPVSDARGAVNLDMVLRGNINNILATQIKGILNLTSVEAFLKYKTPDATAHGPVNLTMSTSFVLTNLVPSISTASWKLKLDDCTLAYKDMFLKEAGITLSSEGTISYITNLNIDRFKLQFHSLDISAKGFASYDRSSDISFNIKPFKLQDFKKFLPNNRDHDISGDVEVDAQIKGFLTQPKNLSANIKKLQASNIKYFLKYKNDQVSLEGPVSLNLFGVLSLESAQVLKGSITGNSDLTGLVVTQDKQIRKTNTDMFKINWSIQAQNGRLNIEKLSVNTFLSSFVLSGRPPMGLDDNFDLKLNLENLNWKKAKTYLPPNEWLNTVADMTNKGTLQIQGKLDPFEIQHSKWSLNTELETNITGLAMPFNFHLSNTPAPGNSAPEAPLTTAPAFIKNKTLLKTVRWNHKVNIQKVTFKDSTAQFQNISLNANLNDSKLTMAGEIGHIFNGKMAFSDVIVPLVEPDPKINFKMTSSNLSFSPLVEFVLPQYKELITGVSSFNVDGKTKIPGTLNFKKDLVAKGNFVIPVSELQTLKIINEVKQQFSAIKDFGVPSMVPVKNLGAATKSEFEIKNLALQLNKFNATIPGGDELNLDGLVKFDLDSKINAVLKLVNLPVHGDFMLANKSQSGGLEIPITIEGNLMKPKWSFAGNTIQKMTQNFIEYQKNKVRQQVDRKVAEVKDQAQAEVEKKKKEAELEIEKKKKELENEAMKKLNGLFK